MRYGLFLRGREEPFYVSDSIEDIAMKVIGVGTGRIYPKVENGEGWRDMSYSEEAVLFKLVTEMEQGGRARPQDR